MRRTVIGLGIFARQSGKLFSSGGALALTDLKSIHREARTTAIRSSKIPYPAIDISRLRLHHRLLRLGRFQGTF